MAVLGTFIDKTTISRAGDAGTTGGQVALTTSPHSLGTTPDEVFVCLRSVQGIAAGAPPLPAAFALGGNSSLNTYGYYYNSGVSAPTMMFDLVAFYFFSMIR